jgi:hypothetical protein
MVEKDGLTARISATGIESVHEMTFCVAEAVTEPTLPELKAVADWLHK